MAPSTHTPDLCAFLSFDRGLSENANRCHRHRVDFLIIPAVFYMVVLSAGLDLDLLRRERWLFEVAKREENWYQFYSYFGGFTFYSVVVALPDIG